MNNTYDIGQSLKEIMTKKHITISALAEKSGLSEDTIKSIRRGKTKNPSITAVAAIADGLSCGIDELLHRQSLSDGEITLLEEYRILDNHGRRKIQAVLEMEKHLQVEKKGAQRTLQCFVPTAKDSDIIFSIHHEEQITIPKNYFSNADFAIRIISNNLHPVFYNGDILAVEKKFPSIGAMGIFVNSQGVEKIRKYVEKDGKMFLESFNSCNKSFFYTDDFVCLGTILGIIRLAGSSESNQTTTDAQ